MKLYSTLTLSVYLNIDQKKLCINAGLILHKVIKKEEYSMHDLTDCS